MDFEKLTFVRRLMIRLRAAAAALCHDERGQATVEYILILSGTVVAAAVLSKAITSGFDAGVLRFGGELERDLKTGRAPPYVWRN